MLCTQQCRHVCTTAVCRLCIPLRGTFATVVCLCVHTPRQRWARKRIVAQVRGPSCKLSTGFTLQPFCRTVILWVTFGRQTKQQVYSVHYKCNHNASCIHGSVGMYALQQHVPSMLLYVGEIGIASLRARHWSILFLLEFTEGSCIHSSVGMYALD